MLYFRKMSSEKARAWLVIFRERNPRSPAPSASLMGLKSLT